MKFGLATTLVLTCCLAGSTLAFAQQDDYSRRGMQTAPPRGSVSNQSPRTIDFTNPQAGTPVQPGTRQIPIQNLPFGQRQQGNFEDMWNRATDSAQAANERAKTAGQKFWDKVSQPFKRDGAQAKPFQFPGNMNMKPNFQGGFGNMNQRPNGMSNLFKPMNLEQPQWMKDMRQKTKDMFSRNKPSVQNGIWADPMANNGGNWREKSNQAWQKFSENMNPQNWKLPGTQPRNVNPPLRQANNWMDGSQTRNR